jgi:HAE1 family hydrophobic/amphiphilic exporter-1
VNITRFSIQRPIGITMIVLLFVVLGLYSFHRIGVELLPALNTPYVTVSVGYPGAGVEAIEQQVIKPLENSLSSLSNLKRMTSMARPERAMIILEFEFHANADYASIEATKRVNAVRGRLPDGVDEPVVVKRDIDASPILEIAVTSKYPLSDIYSKASNIFKERLERGEGVSEVSLYGGRDKEIAIDVNKNKLAFYNLSLSQVIAKVRAENVMMPSGSLFTEKTQTDVRLTAQYANASELSRLQITNSDGANIPLAEIATIKEQDSRATRYGRVNGQDAISLQVYKNSDANIVDTSKAALKQLETLKKEYPDYQFVVVTDSAQFVNNSLKNTLGTLIEGLITTGLVLFIFLRGWRSTLAVMIAIPTSMIATFLAMYITGFTFNMMSLMGMALCVGILVDDSIVVLENIHRHLHMGKEAKQAAEDGRNEIGMAAIAITLCDVVVFLPIAFMTGMTGQFFRQFGLTIVFATLFSLFVSFTLTPMLASKFFAKGVSEPQGRIWDLVNKIERTMVNRYERMLLWSLEHSRKVVVTVLVIFIAAVSLIPAGIIGAEYMPRTDESSFRVNIELPVGQNIDQADAVASKLEAYLLTIPEVKNALASVGTPTGNNASITVQLVDRKDRKRSVWQITDEVRTFSRQKIQSATVRVNETQSSVAGVSGGAGSGGPAGAVQIELLGQSLDGLIAASSRVQGILAQTKGLKDVRSSYTEGMPEIQLTVDREKLKYYNTSVAEVNNSFSAAIAGQKAGVLANNPNNDGLDTDIVVRLAGSDGFKPSDIRSIPIGAGNHRILLGDVAQISEGVGPVMIRRVDKQRAINVTANLTDRPLNEVLIELQQKLTPDQLGGNITYRFTGQASQMDETFGEMIKALLLSLVLVYMLLAILYESYKTPFIRMFSLPLGFIGSLVFLLITNNTINLYSLIGVLVMDGLVAKNGTLLLDYTLTLMEQGMSARDAIIEAGKTRLKPIVMTTMTMVTGMLPTALSMTEGSETRVSMAWVLIGGLLSSTFFTLIVIPIIFLYFEKHPMNVTFFRNAFAYLKMKAATRH